MTVHEIIGTLGFCTAVLVCTAASAWAETPLDGLFTNILASLPLWGQVLVAVGALGLAGLAVYGLSQGPTILITIVIGFAVLMLIVAAATGSLFNFLTRMVV